MGLNATAAICSSHHCHWFCWWVTSVFFFFTGASINFTVILLQKVKIPRHLNISRPLLSYSVPPQISRCSWFSGEPVLQNLQLKSPCDCLKLALTPAIALALYLIQILVCGSDRQCSVCRYYPGDYLLTCHLLCYCFSYLPMLFHSFSEKLNFLFYSYWQMCP